MLVSRHQWNKKDFSRAAVKQAVSCKVADPGELLHPEEMVWKNAREISSRLLKN